MKKKVAKWAVLLAVVMGLLAVVCWELEVVARKDWRMAGVTVVYLVLWMDVRMAGVRVERKERQAAGSLVDVLDLKMVQPGNDEN